MEKLTKKQVFELSLDAYHKKSSDARFTAQEREEGFRNYLADLNKDYRANKNEIFAIIEDTVNIILPVKVQDAIKPFADFQDFPNNSLIKFRVKNGKIKAVSVAVGSTVSRQRIDNGWFVMTTEAVQCKVYEEYERVIGKVCHLM